VISPAKEKYVGLGIMSSLVIIIIVAVVLKHDPDRVFGYNGVVTSGAWKFTGATGNVKWSPPRNNPISFMVYTQMLTLGLE
jgi:hypothetical protein